MRPFCSYWFLPFVWPVCSFSDSLEGSQPGGSRSCRRGRPRGWTWCLSLSTGDALGCKCMLLALRVGVGWCLSDACVTRRPVTARASVCQQRSQHVARVTGGVCAARRPRLNEPLLYGTCTVWYYMVLLTGFLGSWPQCRRSQVADALLAPRQAALAHPAFAHISAPPCLSRPGAHASAPRIGTAPTVVESIDTERSATTREGQRTRGPRC